MIPPQPEARLVQQAPHAPPPPVWSFWLPQIRQHLQTQGWHPSRVVVLVPYAQQPRIGMSFLVRSRAGMVGLDGQMRAALAQLDPRQPITEQFTLSERIAQQLRPARVFSTTVAAFAGLADLADFADFLLMGHRLRRSARALQAAPKALKISR